MENMDDYHKSIGLTSDLESVSFELAKDPAKSPFSTACTFVEFNEEPGEYFDILSLPLVSIERPLCIPNHFREFIVEKIIPYFNCQRKANHLQFAVVLLLSESDLANIKQTRFSPSDAFGRPIVNNSFSLMPQDPSKYGNYIVARPSIRYHSEVKLFEQCSEMTDTPFNHLWRGYVERNRAYPKCVLIYSWYLPCSHCTDVIIKSLGEEPYNRVSVVVAHTAVWSKETVWDHENSKEKLKSKNIAVEQVPYRIHLQHVPLSI